MALATSPQDRLHVRARRNSRSRRPSAPVRLASAAPRDRFRRRGRRRERRVRGVRGDGKAAEEAICCFEARRRRSATSFAALALHSSVELLGARLGDARRRAAAARGAAASSWSSPVTPSRDSTLADTARRRCELLVRREPVDVSAFRRTRGACLPLLSLAHQDPGAVLKECTPPSSAASSSSSPAAGAGCLSVTTLEASLTFAGEGGSSGRGRDEWTSRSRTRASSASSGRGRRRRGSVARAQAALRDQQLRRHRRRQRRRRARASPPRGDSYGVKYRFILRRGARLASSPPTPPHRNSSCA